MSNINSFKNCCICCLETLNDGAKVKLTEKTNRNPETLKVLYEKFLRTKLCPEDPEFLCKKCSQSLRTSYKFWLKCKETREMLDSTKEELMSFETVNEPPVKKPVEDKIPAIKDELSGWGLCKYVDSSTTDVSIPSVKVPVDEGIVKDELKGEVEEVLSMKLNIPEEKEQKQINSSAQNSNIRCHLCPTQFRNLDLLAIFSHLRKRHFKKESIQCPLCCNIYADPSPRYRCLHCSDLVINFHSHIEKTHPFEKLYKCHHCPKMSGWPTRSRLAEHMTRAHLTNRPCKICGQTFKTQYDVTKHRIKVHSRGQDLTCFYCDYTTSLKRAFENHIIQHTGLKEFSCDICKKKFGHDDALKKHRLTHEKDRKFQCEKCHAGFTTAKGLFAHQKVHEKPEYECPRCNRMFKRNPELTRHIRKFHPKYLPPKGTVMNKKYLAKVREGLSSRPTVITEIQTVPEFFDEVERELSKIFDL